jgi:hypothetical protein
MKSPEEHEIRTRERMQQARDGTPARDRSGDQMRQTQCATA